MLMMIYDYAAWSLDYLTIVAVQLLSEGMGQFSNTRDTSGMPGEARSGTLLNILLGKNSPCNKECKGHEVEKSSV